MIMVFQTEFEFELPKGYIDKEGNLHKKGLMRLATGGDEILPQKDPRVQQNPAYLTMIVLARVITKLGDLTDVNPKVIENLFASDLSYLQSLYQEINGNGQENRDVTCPKCEHTFEVEMSDLGEA